jgi:GrpB-like predicted nucleotidyltransferase (UPF0157 family)
LELQVRFLHPQDYQPIANKIFEDIRQKFELMIPNANIQHVGSSAVDGAISKGDLDIFIGVPRDHHSETVRVFEQQGFKIKKGTLRTDELCMLEAECYQIDVAVQIVALGSKFEFFLEFRDKLRADSRLVHEYNDLKRSFQGASPDKYREAKSEFIERVLLLKSRN